MTNRARLFAFLLLTLLCLSVARSAAAQSTPNADERLRSLYTAEWDWRQQQFARHPGDVGRGITADHLPRVDATAQKARLAYWTRVLAQLDAIDPGALSAPERLNGEIFRAVIEELAGDSRFKSYEAPFNADTFFWTSFTPREGFVTADEYRRYLGRLRDVPRYFDEQIGLMEGGLYQSIRLGTFTHVYPYAPGLALPAGPSNLRVISTATSGITPCFSMFTPLFVYTPIRGTRNDEPSIRRVLPVPMTNPPVA